MDELGLTTLHAELQADARVVADAARLARQRLGAGAPCELEAAKLTALVSRSERVSAALPQVLRDFCLRVATNRGWAFAGRSET